MINVINLSKLKSCQAELKMFVKTNKLFENDTLTAGFRMKINFFVQLSKKVIFKTIDNQNLTNVSMAACRRRLNSNNPGSTSSP